MRNRAWRRAQRERKIAEVKTWMTRTVFGRVETKDEQLKRIHEWSLRRHSSPQTCSRYCCGNPRKHFGTLTEQEVRNNYHCAEEYSEYNIRKDFHIGSKGW